MLNEQVKGERQCVCLLHFLSEQCYELVNGNDDELCQSIHPPQNDQDVFLMEETQSIKSPTNCFRM